MLKPTRREFLQTAGTGIMAGSLLPSLSAFSKDKKENVQNNLQAKWIWKKHSSYRIYNQTIIVRKTFHTGQFSSAKIKITADSFYRLFINGQWVNDGPARSWPEHYRYDEVDCTSYLQEGTNQIRIVARYWGVGTFHNVCQQAGLLTQLEIRSRSGAVQTVATDETWEAAQAPAWLRNTPKVSIQMEPQEFYDARLEDRLRYKKAAVLFTAGNGPWQDLQPRDVALLTKKPFPLHAFSGANLIKRNPDLHFCIPTTRLTHPGLIEANHNISNTCGIATILQTDNTVELQFEMDGMEISVDGQRLAENRHKLNPGRHFVLAFVTEVTGHRREKAVGIIDPPGSLKLLNPLEATYENPWCWINFPEYSFASDDLGGKKPADKKKVNSYLTEIKAYFRKVKDAAGFRAFLGERVKNMPSGKMFVPDNHWLFTNRKVLRPADSLLRNPGALLQNAHGATGIIPSTDGDIELIYDLGEQNIGYYDFELTAEEGVIIDIFGIEYIAPGGRIQHTRHNRNGMRYITKAGLNRFTSLKRRSGRYLFITLRNQESPVQFHKFQLIESTYPVNPIGAFTCSDERLDKIWDISARTLKLCMEDTFTDCPLYEQTLWVGDARNEAVFAFSAFGAADIAKRCIRLAAQSLERFPITGCQVPSGWEILLPAWSFLWGISVWDYYFYSGDKNFLREIWPDVLRNLAGARKYLNRDDLFSLSAWNMFDWSGIDDRHKTVLHNSMLLTGAVQAAIRCADVLEDQKSREWLDDFRNRLKEGINKYWDEEKQAYPDSIHEDGSVSDSTSQHTNFLSILYDIVEKKHFNAALKNILSPPEKMVPVGSPFAMFYLYEALEKTGREDDIIRSIYESYLPMLNAGATTVWETFPSSSYRPGEFPTRSHAHAWSSSPLFYLNRVILGIKQTKPGGSGFDISPRLHGLNSASGTVATIEGPLSVSWRAAGKKLTIRIDAPKNVKVKFVKNETHKNLAVEILSGA
ncbi:MAG TPA: hypothetical protein ENH29_00225 [Bacteroidetes bacterium]|nr:hypothetical protein [Bacteroidota bacterium]